MLLFSRERNSWRRHTNCFCFDKNLFSPLVNRVFSERGRTELIRVTERSCFRSLHSSAIEKWFFSFFCCCCNKAIISKAHLWSHWSDEETKWHVLREPFLERVLPWCRRACSNFFFLHRIDTVELEAREELSRCLCFRCIPLSLWSYCSVWYLQLNQQSDLEVVNRRLEQQRRPLPQLRPLSNRNRQVRHRLAQLSRRKPVFYNETYWKKTPRRNPFSTIINRTVRPVWRKKNSLIQLSSTSLRGTRMAMTSRNCSRRSSTTFLPFG